MWLRRAIALAILPALIGCSLADSEQSESHAGAHAKGVCAAIVAYTVTMGDTVAPEPDGSHCPHCDGAGVIPLGDTGQTQQCPDCNGTGKRIAATPIEATEPRGEVIQSPATPPVVDKAPSTAKPAQEVNVWYSNYEAAGKVALETGRPLIVAVTATKPDYEPTAGTVFCWLDSAIHAHEWEPFNPPCLLLCERVTNAPPEFTPTTLEAL